MPRRLDVVRDLFRELREPCPVDMLGLPRVAGGFACAECGRVVVDVAGLTFEEAVEFRRRAQSGGDRLCGAYTVDRDSRVLLRAAPHSSKVVAIAVSALLAACETGARPSAEPVASASEHVAIATGNAPLLAAPSGSAVVDPARTARIAPSTTSAGPEASAPSAAPSAAAAHDTKSPEPQCAKGASPSERRGTHKARSKNDPEVLGGY